MARTLKFRTPSPVVAILFRSMAPSEYRETKRGKSNARALNVDWADIAFPVGVLPARSSSGNNSLGFIAFTGKISKL